MSSELFSVEGKVVVITGGLGQLGRQFSKVLIEHGAKVVILDTAADGGALPGEFDSYLEQAALLYLQADVTKRTSLELALASVEEQFGEPPFGLINNAALDSPPNSPPEETGPFETFPEDSWDRVMNVNVKGVFLACQVFGDAMAKAGRGSIINIGSIYGVVSPDPQIYRYKEEMGGEPFFKPVAYSASKSALINFTRYISVYWGSHNVRANLISLGGVFNQQDEYFLKGYCQKVPLGRMAREDEYNGAIIYLMSDASSYLTGSNMMIDGGWTAL